MHECLQSSLSFALSEDDVSLVYPYVSHDSPLRKKLIAQCIFVPLYWPHIPLDVCPVAGILPLPIDQRYGEEDMKRIVSILIKKPNMESRVLFRDFEERDIGFIYRCKNDDKLNAMIVGPYHPFTYEEAEEWVHGCMGEHDTFKFWAICSNDEEKRIVGWVSLSNIDKDNRCACFHSIVIGDDDYRDGMAWIESYLFIYSYVFDVLNFNRLYGSNIEEQIASYSMGYAMFEKMEGKARQAKFKNGHFVDIVYMSILRDEYMYHKNNGDFDCPKIIRRLAEARKAIRRGQTIEF